MNTMTAFEISEQLKVPYSKVLVLLRSRSIPAEKKKGRWVIACKDYYNFKRENAKKIKNLQDTYFSLYRQGLTHYQLQQRVSADFKDGCIVAPIKGFAETTIYEALKSGDSH